MVSPLMENWICSCVMHFGCHNKELEGEDIELEDLLRGRAATVAHMWQ